MSELFYQVRFDVIEEIASEVRNKNYKKLNENLSFILEEVKADLVCQYDAFKNFVLECEKENEVNNALYKWTKDTIENKVKKQKYLKSFTIYVEGEQLYDKKIADFLECEINCLIDIFVRIGGKPETSPPPANS